MAKKVLKLDFVDIVMGARADVIKEAYEARLKIDDLLDAREEAYQKIAQIEERVEDIVGVSGDFIFPAPPLPVAGIPRPADTNRPKTAIPQKPQETVEEKLEALNKDTPYNQDSATAQDETPQIEDTPYNQDSATTQDETPQIEDTPYNEEEDQPQEEMTQTEDTPCEESEIDETQEDESKN